MITKGKNFFCTNHIIITDRIRIISAIGNNAWITKSTTARELEQSLRLEKFILSQLKADVTILNYTEVNEAALREGIANSTVRRIKTLLYFLSLKGYIRKEEHTASGNVSIELLTDTPPVTRAVS